MKSLEKDSVEIEIKNQRGATKERKWLVWLLKVWEENERKPTWFMIKRQWPDEYELIIAEVGPWETVERKLEVARQIKEQTAEQKMLTELQKSRALCARQKYSLEEHIVGLIRLMAHLDLDRLPMMEEISAHSKTLGTPHVTSYQRQMVTKENWLPCIKRYQETPIEERPEALREMEVELAKQRQERWERDGMFRDRNAKRGEYTREMCLGDLAKVYEHFGRIPKRAEIEQFSKENGTACYGTMNRHLGMMTSWSAQLAEFLANREIEAYVETCEDLKQRGPQALNPIFERVKKAATASEKLVLEKAVERMKRAVRQKPAVFECELDGREYEIVVRPKR